MALLIAGVLFSGTLNAQIHLFLEEQVLTLPDGKVTAWVFPAAANQEETLNDMKEYLKDRSDLKLRKDGDEMLIAEKVTLPAITTKRGDLIGLCRISEQYYSMAIILKLGYDISLSVTEWPTEMENLHKYVKTFMTFHYEQVYARRINGLEKEIKDVEKNRDQTENKIEGITDKINNNGKKIAKETDTAKINELQSEINTLEADMKQLMDTLPGLESQLESLKKEVDQNRSESSAYLSTIATF
jgi:outer membrane murein-binding lipoprotein Lpp